MVRLAKYLKPFIPLLLIAIGLLLVQALSDLSLPNYLSQIVDVGIQQGGVENVAAAAVRQSAMNRLTLFMSEADKAAVLSHYTLVDSSSPQYAADVKLYPDLAKEPAYVLNALTPAETDQLNTLMAPAWVATSAIEQIMADPSKAAALGAGGNFDISKLPPGTDLFKLLAQLPAAQ